MSLSRTTFYDSIRKSLFRGSLTQRQVVGIAALLDAWDVSGYTDLRWLAACLATAFHETAQTMYPVEEWGKGKGHPYGKPGKHGGQIPYGRGLVQLTWDTNYERADKELGLNGALLANYALALDPVISAKILFRGEAEGWFTRFKLSDYLHDDLTDWLHCRRIINGMDCASKIAGYSVKFYAAIEASMHVGKAATS